MAKRPLNETEKKFATKNLIILEDELEYKEIELARKELSIRAAPIEYKKQVKQMQHEEKIFRAELKELQGTITTLRSQINTGVEPKKNATKQKTLNNFKK